MPTVIIQTRLNVTIIHSMSGLVKLACLYKFHVKIMSYI